MFRFFHECSIKSFCSNLNRCLQNIVKNIVSKLANINTMLIYHFNGKYKKNLHVLTTHIFVVYSAVLSVPVHLYLNIYLYILILIYADDIYLKCCILPTYLKCRLVRPSILSVLLSFIM